MKFETLKKDNKKKIAIGIMVVISLTLVGVFASSFAKYKLTESISLVRGTINYKAYDFKIMAMYQQKTGSTCTEDNCYDEIETMPNASNYKINESKSYCTIDNKNKDSNAVLRTIDGYHIIESLSKNSKCYLYFDEICGKACKLILTNESSTIGATSFTGIETENAGMFSGTDNDGITYYYRGAVTNNYLKFANKWWRIIRINGNGSIRIIYDGTAYHANGTSTTDSIAVTSQPFSKDGAYNDNAYIGFMYGTPKSSTYEETHANINKSNVLTQLELWYANNLANYTNRIDTNAGFCGDRSINTSIQPWWNSDSKKGFGTNSTAYGLWSRTKIASSSRSSIATPTFNCPNSNDLYTVSGASKGNKALAKPIGLITADEIIYAGGFLENANNKYYLFNGQVYWAISPSYVASSSANVSYVYSDGKLGLPGVNNLFGIRPVINLRADVPITGSGTQNDPYVVN